MQQTENSNDIPLFPVLIVVLPFYVASVLALVGRKTDNARAVLVFVFESRLEGHSAVVKLPE
jgi:hypothetical protein